jgi:hypothetical protein
MDLSRIYEKTDAVFFMYLFFIGFSRYLVNPTGFYPAVVVDIFFSYVSYFGFSPTPRLFWIGAGLLAASIGLRVLQKPLDYFVEAVREKSLNLSLKSDGEEYLEENNVQRFPGD